MIWWVSWVILLGYFLLIFRSRQLQGTDHLHHDTPGVSIIVAIKNGSDLLRDHLPSMLSQSYPLYEVIIVDDHSDEEERNKLELLAIEHREVILIHAEGSPGKKQALMAGVEKAKYHWILCTDADCAPVSDQWISTMMRSRKDAGMVLGYSPYKRKGGLLNHFVRFETSMTAIQYLSWAMLGRPYMGVGRNLLYAKDLFLKAKPYERLVIPYGDDDLWVQQAALLTRVNVCFDPSAHVLSVAPKTWQAWWEQKHRHLSAAHHYARSTWWQPGMFGVALILHWATLFIVLFSNLPMWVPSACLVGVAMRWLVYHSWARELNEKKTAILYPVLEMIYTLYLSVMGIMTLVAKKKTWN